MSSIQKLEQKFWADPIVSDLTWPELIRLLLHLGYEQRQGSGSRVKLINDQKHRISLHKPHPSNVIKTYVIRDVRKSLDEHRRTL